MLFAPKQHLTHSLDVTDIAIATDDSWTGMQLRDATFNFQAYEMLAEDKVRVLFRMLERKLTIRASFKTSPAAPTK